MQHSYSSSVDGDVVRSVQGWVMHVYVPHIMRAIETYNTATLNSIVVSGEGGIAQKRERIASAVIAACESFNGLLQTHIVEAHGHGLPFTAVVLNNTAYMHCLYAETLWQALDPVFVRHSRRHAQLAGRLTVPRTTYAETVPFTDDEDVKDAVQRMRFAKIRREQQLGSRHFANLYGYAPARRDFPDRMDKMEENEEWTFTKDKSLSSPDGSIVWAGQQADYSPTYVLISYGSCPGSDGANTLGIDAGIHNYGPQPAVARSTNLQLLVIWDPRVRQLFMRLIPDDEHVIISRMLNALYGIASLLGESAMTQVFETQVLLDRVIGMHRPELYDNTGDWERYLKKAMWDYWTELVQTMDGGATLEPDIGHYDPAYTRFIEACPPEEDDDYDEALSHTARWRLSNGDYFWVQAHQPSHWLWFCIARSTAEGRFAAKESLHPRFRNGHAMVYECGTLI